MRSEQDGFQDLTTAALRAQSAAGVEQDALEMHVVHPPELRTAFVSRDARIVLGRKLDGAGLMLRHASVSRTHFLIVWDAEAGMYTGVDAGSSHGSSIDGIAAQTPLGLHDGSVVRIGPALLIVERSDGSAVPAPAVAGEEAVPGRAVATRKLRREVVALAADPSPLLLSGQTGTGKEFIARELHRQSGRRGKFVAVNCAALSDQLVESELFGHVRGAFTGAGGEQPGLFREAEGGTLLLDEVGELSLHLQPKLLRVLQERCVRPVGGARELAVDVRVIAATHRDLNQMVQRGEFRRDLYARLALCQLDVPSLQRRRADLLEWLERLYGQWCAVRDVERAAPLAFDTTAAEALLLRAWPDNLRGLDRLVHAIAPLGGRRSPLGYSDLPRWLWAESEPSCVRDVAPAVPSIVPDSQKPKPAIPSKQELADLLAQNDGSVRATARQLARDRRQVYRWMNAFGLKEK